MKRPRIFEVDDEAITTFGDGVGNGGEVGSRFAKSKRDDLSFVGETHSTSACAKEALRSPQIIIGVPDGAL